MPSRKPTDYVQFKLRIRQSLLKQLQREAAKKKHSANNEAVERLEQSFDKDAQGQRDSAIIDMLVDHNDVSSELLRKIAFELQKNPDWFRSEADMKHMVEGLYFAAYGKEPDEEPRPGEEL
jgi:hypothetical protein